jgi:hypothetical protein
MPTVAGWANDLRAVFGTDEINDALRQAGYYASEGGRTIDTRPRNRPMREVSVAEMVVIKTPCPTKAGSGNAR